MRGDLLRAAGDDTTAAIEWWGTAGQRSMARYALVEGAEQLKRALDQIATLPATPALRREEIKLHVAFANALTLTGDFVEAKSTTTGRSRIYDSAEHGSLTTRSGRDIKVALLASRSGCAWLLGYPAAARSDAARAVKNAREIEHATTLLHALHLSEWNHIRCGNYAVAHTQVDELIALADQRGAPGWKALGTATRGCLFALTGKASEAVRAITSAITLLPSTGAALYEPQQLQYLAMAYAELGQLHDAWRCIDDAIDKTEKSKEKWCEAEVHRIAGEVELKSLAPDPEKAEAYFDHALAVARQQQAKSWELRAAMSMARLWRDQALKRIRSATAVFDSRNSELISAIATTPTGPLMRKHHCQEKLSAIRRAVDCIGKWPSLSFTRLKKSPGKSRAGARKPL